MKIADPTAKPSRVVYPTDASRLWQFCHILFRFLLRPLTCSLRVEGACHIPRTGGAVIACNHPGGMDVIFLGYGSPRQIFYMAKQELFNVHPLMTSVIWRLGAFPVNRGARDSAAIKYSIQLLREGRVLGMFPEGTRNRGGPLGRGKSGAVRIALEADVPMVPAVVLGVPDFHKQWYHPLKRTQMLVRFGEPMRFQAGDMAHVSEYTAEVMFAIARMMPAELRGPYGESQGREMTRPPL